MNTTEINESKARIFDILEAQSSLQIKINEFEKAKAEEYKKLNELRRKASESKRESRNSD